MKWRVAFSALLAIFLLLPSFAAAQLTRTPPVRDTRARTYFIRGNLRFSHNEKPVENLKIELRRFAGDVVGTTFTRTNGEFEFSGLTTGQFFLIVEEAGYEPVRELVEVSSTSHFGMIVYLKKEGTSPPAEGGAIVSAEELKLPSKTRSAFRKGMDILYGKHDAAASLPVLKKVTLDAPSFYEAFFHLGIAYNQLDRMTEAEEAYRKSISISAEKYPRALIALAALLTSQEKAVEAEGLVRRALALDADLWQGHYEMGRALVALNRLEEAERSLRQAIKLQHDSAPAYLLLANIHIRMKNHSALLADLNEFLRLEPDGPQSAQARKVRDSILKAMEEAKSAPATPPPPKP
ncbi:MAG: tetratricopeptide repeat protein [Acidobacteria bacterium]|nr:tetratricopeptide repeat protein [Acidobacteriota bacterium]MCL5286422.1 tetratricopeptide repeat protein [Acidobacteriota bacterium]